MFEALTMFFTTVYKKITITEMEDLRNRIDIEYLRDLPYPAPLTEQKYLSDIIETDGSVGELIKWK